MLDGLVLAAYQVEAYDFPVKNQVEDRNFKRDRELWTKQCQPLSPIGKTTHTREQLYHSRRLTDGLFRTNLSRAQP
jgi:hypothetical protein